MMFVDGENLTIRAEKRCAKLNQQIENLAAFYRPQTCFWPKAFDALQVHWSNDQRLASESERSYYYTATKGSNETINEIRDQLLLHRFSPVVFKKANKDKKAKGVDICLTKDMLVHAFAKNYDTAVLVAGDGDYVPVVEEVKRCGRQVFVVFFDSAEDGLNPELRRAADRFLPLRLVDNR